MPTQSSPASRPNDEAMAEIFRDDPEFALNLLNDILADGDQAELLIALRKMKSSFGGAENKSDQAHINHLYLELSKNPDLISLIAVLKAMGLRVTVERTHVA